MAQITFKLPERIVAWPGNKSEPDITSKEMFAKLVCNPPLGQATVIPPDTESVTFSVLLEVDPASQKQWQIALWHDLGGPDDEWKSADFQEVSADQEMLHVQCSTSPNKNQRRIYTLELPGKPNSQESFVRFTIKFRPDNDSPWKWARDHTSLNDGVLYYQASNFKQQELSHYLKGIDSDLSIETIAAETPDTSLWSLTAPVAPAVGDESGTSTHSLGLPFNFTRWFALVRLWIPWLAPRHGQGKFRPDKDAILASFLRHDGLHVVVLAISGVDDVLTVLKYDAEGNVTIEGKNDDEEPGISRVIIAVASTFEVANAAVMYQARRIAMAYAKSTGALEAELEAMKLADVKPEWLEGWSDGFAFCTWNSLGQDLTEDKIYAALDSLEKNDIKITNLIIDDNWQSLDNEGMNQIYRGMTEFEANKKGFPQGLAHTVSKIRKDHPSIQHIAVWHALMGYWGAIAPEGKLAKEYKTLKINGPDWTAIDPEDIMRWYNDFYSFLSSSGVDSVKTDAQFMLDQLGSAKDRRRLIRAYQDAWSIANLRHLSARAISCMSQTPQMLFHSQLPSNKPKLLVRNSDDFFPDVDSSHPWHVFCNAYNSLFTQHLNALPDWDMFQTSHPWAGFHAAARCVSGGPIYITDSPGQHDIDLIKQMTAKTPRGKTVILRPHRLGKSSQAYVGYEEQQMLKIDTYVGMSHTGISILGVFNVSQNHLSEILSLNDFPGTEKGEYVIRSHVGGKCTKPAKQSDKKISVCTELGTKGYDILSAYPILGPFEVKSGQVSVAPLGLVGKMTGAAAIVNLDTTVETNGRLRIWISLKAFGVYGIYISDLAKRSIEEEFMGLLFGKPIPLHCVKRSGTDENVLEIDIERAWNEGEKRVTWSNEVNVEFFIG
ncbi:hypothetical protein Vi05172_g4892 [Venturia inaequalis]|nr:hypothetical protein Vi05172_g4892 [Venturia inaequalis]